MIFLYQVSRLGVCEILFNTTHINKEQLRQVKDLIVEGKYFEEKVPGLNLVTFKFWLSAEAHEKYTDKTIRGMQQCESIDKAVEYIDHMNEEVAEGFYRDLKDRLLDIGIKEHYYSLRVY